MKKKAANLSVVRRVSQQMESDIPRLAGALIQYFNSRDAHPALKKIFLQQTEQEQSAEDLRREEETWRITHQEATARVRALRAELESYRDQIDAVAFDILAEGIPACLDHSERRFAVDVLEKLNPIISGLFKRCDEIGRRGASEGVDFNRELFDLKTQLAETGFQVGLLAGAMFSSAPKETVDKFERGLLYAISVNPRIVKGIVKPKGAGLFNRLGPLKETI